MKLGTRVKLAGIFTIGLFLAYGAALLYMDRTMAHLAQEVQDANQFRNKISLLRTLSLDNLIYQTERSKKQWAAVYGEVRQLLDNKEYRELQFEYGLGDIGDKLKIVGDTFQRLLAMPGLKGLTDSEGEIHRELRNRLTTQLLLTTQDLLNRFVNLSEEVNQRLIRTQRLISLLDILALLALGLIILSAGVFLQRSVLRPVLKLHEGAEIIGAGNLDYKVGMDSRDELGELSRAFDRMTANLQQMTLSLNMERQRFYNVLEMLPAYIVLLTPDYHVTFANRYFVDRFGEDQGRRCFEYLFGRTEPCEICETYKVLMTNAPQRWEWTGPDSKNYDIYDYPFTDADGSPLIMEMGLDITERKGAQEEIQKLNAELEQRVLERTAELERSRDELVKEMAERQLAEQALWESREDLNRAQAVGNIGSWRLDVRKNELTWSDENHRIFGLPPGTPMTYETFLGTVHPEDREYVDREWQAGLRGEPYDIEHRIIADGRIKWVRERAELEFDPEGRLLGGFGTTQDITERKRAEEAIIRAKEEWERTFDTVPDLIAILDKEHRITRVNKAMAKLLGKGAEEAIGQPCFKAVHGLEEVPDFCPHVRVLATGQAHSTEVQEFGRIFAVTVSPIFAPDGQLIGGVHVARDITESKQAEEAIKERSAELARAVTDLEETNAEMERFTYMISHDLKSPLVTISTFLGFLQEDMGRGDTNRIDKDIKYIRTAADKMGQLLGELLEMSRIGRLVNPSEEVTFKELMQEVMAAVAGSIAAGKVEVEVGADDVTLFGDRPRLVEIWQNLMENAVKFMGEQENPRLTIGLERQEEDTIFFVCDNGIGIEPKYQGKIFGIFEKLDSKIGGTGIGLAVVKRIVELYQGKIWVESAGSGQGACFRFTLPEAVKRD